LTFVAAAQSTGVRILGRYALYDEIAAGGMATVHIGRLIGPVGFSRTVAIKRLHPQHAKDPDFVSMFLDEARLAARIRHPNVVGTLDVVALSGELFLVMEYVQGESLARLMKGARESGRLIPLPILSSMLVGALDGLHAAHEATNDQGEPLGIVHRDVSPHNILVGSDGVARVLDFGVAKAAGRIQTTKDGQLKGKISYMAPEQIHGTVDRTTDVYALSVVLWEALTGRRLFYAENDAKTLANVMSPKVDPPSRHVPTIPKELDALVLKGLASEPANRFPTAREMARALQKVVPIAPASDVSDWVEMMAGGTIAARAKRVALIESSTPAAPPDSESVPSIPMSLTPVSGPVPVSHRSSANTALDGPVRDAPTRSLSVASMVGGKRPSTVLIIGGAIAVGVAGYLVATHMVQGKAAAPVAAAAVPATPASPKPSAATATAPAPSDSTPTTSVDDLPTAAPTRGQAARGNAATMPRATNGAPVKPVTAPISAPNAAATPHKPAGDIDVLSGRK
jgi:serine/threonine-protein kinase